MISFQSIKSDHSSCIRYFCLFSAVYTVSYLELHALDVHLIESLAWGFELWCNDEHLATWKTVGPLFWFLSFPHANLEKCLLIIEFTYPRSLEVKKNDLPEFASVLSESCTAEKVVLAILSLVCWLLLLHCYHYFLEKEGYTQAFMLIA